jgi:hypothetical protein
MPAMPRVKGRATNIAYAILGKPNNPNKDKSRKDRLINKRLNFEETFRAR